MRECLPGVRAYARTVCRDTGTAEEITQETFIRAWRYWPTFRNDSGAMPWLITICRRVAADIARKNRIHDQLPPDMADSTNAFDATAVNELVRTLPQAQREVIVLCAILGFDYQTAAETLGIPVGTVRSRIARARESLAAEVCAADAV